MTKVLRVYMPDQPVEEMARFEVRPDGRVEATYANEALRARHELGGVYTVCTGRVHPADGAVFLEALELSLSVSSFWRLEDA